MTHNQEEIIRLWHRGHTLTEIHQLTGKSKSNISQTLKRARGLPCPFSSSCFNCPMDDCVIKDEYAHLVNQDSTRNQRPKDLLQIIKEEQKMLTYEAIEAFRQLMERSLVPHTSSNATAPNEITNQDRDKEYIYSIRLSTDPRDCSVSVEVHVHWQTIQALIDHATNNQSQGQGQSQSQKPYSLSTYSELGGDTVHLKLMLVDQPMVCYTCVLFRPELEVIWNQHYATSNLPFPDESIANVRGIWNILVSERVWGL